MKIGKQGETFFKNLCNSVDIIATEPDEDERGWDFLLEFPTKKDPSISLDKLDSNIECKVQLKSTKKLNQKSLQFKLSAINYLIKVNLPTFICFIHFDKKRAVKKVFLIHIDKPIIERVLTRVRQSVAEGTKLNKLNITINYDEVNCIENFNNGVDLKEKIESYISIRMSEYIKNKTELIENIGFDKNSLKINFSVYDEDIKGIDISKVGSSRDIYIPIKINSIIENRFGINLPISNTLTNGTSVKMNILSKQKDVEILIKKSKFSAPIIIDAKVSKNPLIPNMILFNAKFFTLNLNTQNDIGNFNFDFNDETLFKLSELTAYMELLSLSYENKEYISIIIRDKIENKDLITSKLKYTSLSIEDSLYNLIKLIRCFKILVNHLEIPLNKEIDIKTIKTIDKQIILMEQIHNNKKLEMDFSISKYHKIVKGTTFNALIPLTIELDKILYGCIFYVKGKSDSILIDKIKASLYDVRIAKTFVTTQNEYNYNEIVEDINEYQEVKNSDIFLLE